MIPTATVLDTIKNIKGEELVPAPTDNANICNPKILLIGCGALF